ncbi:MAG: tetratricopeptide repeat protein [Bacteriovoracaceae bacterium]
MKNFPLSLAILTLALSACSGLNKTKDSAQVIAQNKVSRDEVIKNLERLVRQAKNQGVKAEEFLATDFFLKASSAHSYGDYQTAAILYKFLIELRPNETFVKNKYAITLIRTGELEEALKVLQEVNVATNGKEEKVGLILAGVHTALNQSEEAKKIYQQVLKVHPQSQDACVFLSKAYSSEKSFNKAFDLLDKCEKVSKEKGVFAYYKGKTYLDKGNLVAAFKEFVRAKKLDPEFTQATLAIGLIHEEKGEAEKAITSYKQYLLDNADDKVILSRLVQVYFSQEKHAEVLPFAERLSELEPDNLNLKVKLGILYSDNKNYNKAKQIFKDVLAFNDSSDRILYYLGALHQETKEFDDAIHFFGRVPASSPLYQDSSLQVAQMMGHDANQEKFKKEKTFHKEKTERFISYVDQKMDEIPLARVEFAVVKASHFENAENNQDAIKSMEVVVQEKNFEDNHRYYLASLYEKEKRYEETIGVIAPILNRDPNNAQALNFLGYSMLERGENFDKAFEYITKAVKISPKDGFIRDSLGWYYFKLGKVEQALKEVKEAKRLVADDPVITKHLAQIYESMNRYTDAKNYYMEALKNCKFEYERADIYKSLSNLENLRLPASKK